MVAIPGFFMQSVEYFSSEKVSVWLLIAVLLAYLVIVGFLFAWALLARIKVMAEGSRIWPAIRSAFGFASRRFFPTLLLVSLFFCLHILLFFIYWIICDSSLASVWWILFFVLVQQGIAFVRVLVRIMTYAGVGVFYGGLDRQID